jgi:hypothetical protein
MSVLTLRPVGLEPMPNCRTQVSEVGVRLVINNSPQEVPGGIFATSTFGPGV